MTRAVPRPRTDTVLAYTIHGIANPYLPYPLGDRRHSFRDWLAYEFLDPALATRCDLLVSPSNAIAHDVVRRLHYPSRLMKVIPNGVDVDRMEFRSPTGSGEIGTLSRLDGFKGIDIFVKAAAQLIKRGVDENFVAFGNGEEEESLRALVEDLGIEDRFRFGGHVPAHEALDQLKVFVMSSYWENAPVALLEAMSSGVPVVATNAWGIPEIAPNDCALLVQPGDPDELADAIRLALSSPGEMLTRAKRARARVESTFTKSINAETMLQAYQAAIEERMR